MPGTSSAGLQVSTSFTYDTLGNVLTVISPGNNAATTKTTTFNYVNDNGTTVGASIGLPYSEQDNLGHTSTFLYDNQGNCIQAKDALGNTVTGAYNLANQCDVVTYPTSDTLTTGLKTEIMTYLYPGSVMTSDTAYDEGGTADRETFYAYGAEGEVLAAFGSTEYAAYSYDALYRTASVQDGNGNTTRYSYNLAGYPSQIVYPGAGSTAVGAPDTVSATSYDGNGDVLTRVDGRG
jgi:YD repeat-containing protein